MVIRGAVAHAIWGLAIGIPTTLLCGTFVEAQLYEVKGINGAVMAASVLTLAGAAFVAGLIPAQRAASIEPARALRNE
jgi:ABC-type lipoprotein release transport system permease subunit